MSISACDFKDCELIVVDSSKYPDSFFFAKVVKDKRIRIFGWIENYLFDHYFSVTDMAVFDRLHFPFSGPITQINEKTVTISVDGNRCKTLNISEFIRMNAFKIT